MRHLPHIHAVLLAFLFLDSASPATAQGIVLTNNSGSAFAESTFPGTAFLPSTRDERFFGPNGGGAVGDVDLRHFGHMRAVQLGIGLNAVSAEGRVSDISFFDFSAGTKIDWTAENTGPFAPSLIFQYHVNGGELALYDPANLFDGMLASVSVSIFTIAPGFSGFLWSWDLTLRGSRGVVTPSVDFLIDPLGFGTPVLSPVTISGGVAHLDIAPFTAEVDLGPIFPGGTAFITYDMSASVSGVGFNSTGGLARLGDPFDLSGNYGAGISLTAGPTVATPEPTTWSLLLLGLGGLGLMARRARTSPPNV